MRTVAKVAGPIAFTLVLLELGTCALARGGLLKIDLPKYALPRWESSLGSGKRFWADLDPHFGVWHEPGATYHHQRECFDVHYSANSHGMRDVERERTGSSRRVVVLGDSMIEGYGVEREARLTDLLERSTGVPHLNFGTSGDFGPTPYYLLYKHFAKHFSHDTVIVGLLPFNDFRDDDIELGKRVFPDRYRPYWIGEHPNYRLVYYPAKLDEAQVRGEDPKVTLKTVLREFTHLYGALTLVKRSAVSEQPAKYSGYYDFTERELLRLQHSLRLLREEAAGRRVILLLLPALPDLQRYGRAGARPTPLAERLQAFSAAHDMEIVDLLPLLYEREREHEALFLPCDGHWNERGHAAAHAALLNRLQSGAREAQAEAPAAPDAGVKP